jgi:hypothetical protein
MPRASSVRIELDRDGVGELLTSAAVQAMLDTRAEAVAAAARGRGITVHGSSGEIPLPVEVVSAGTTKRARALVSVDHPAGLRVESKHRLLVGSLDAARR